MLPASRRALGVKRHEGCCALQPLCTTLSPALPVPLQAEDRFNFRMCGRHDMYAALLARYVRPDFEPQVVRDPSLPAPPGSTA